LNRDLDLADGTPLFFSADTVWVAFTKKNWNAEGIAGIFFYLSYSVS